jgi:hypothetical protein
VPAGRGLGCAIGPLSRWQVEPPRDANGNPPALVFLVGREDGAYRIGLVIQSIEDDDD